MTPGNGRNELTCDSCNRSTLALVEWRRRAPSRDDVNLCGLCIKQVVRQADDRGPEEEDMLRLVGVYSRLGGEVWSDGGRAYWFRAPFIHRPSVGIADLLAKPKPTKPKITLRAV